MKPIYKVSSTISESERIAAFEKALAALPQDDRECLEEQADRLIDAVKAFRQDAQFSRAMALELLACLGMWLVD